MSRLYGTITNEQSKTSTRTANRIVTAAAQSWNGSVAVTIRFDQIGREIVNIAVGEGSQSDPTRVLLSVPLADMLAYTELNGRVVFHHNDAANNCSTLPLGDDRTNVR